MPSYIVTIADGTKTELPAWMAEPEAAHGAALHERAVASVAGLVALRHLIDDVRREWAGSADRVGARPSPGETP